MAESGRFVKKKFPFCINVFSVKKSCRTQDSFPMSGRIFVCVYSLSGVLFDPGDLIGKNLRNFGHNRLHENQSLFSGLAGSSHADENAVFFGVRSNSWIFVIKDIAQLIRNRGLTDHT